jgi:hypothetical protein
VRASTLLALYVAYRVWFPKYSTSAYDGVNGQVGFALGFLGVAVMALLASIGGRDRGVEIVQALPAGGRSRVQSWFVLLAVIGALEYLALLVNRAVRDAPWYAELLPDAWEIAQGPLMLVGAGLLGLFAARLLPPWIAAPVCVVASVAWVGIFSNNVPSGTMLAPVIEWVQYHDEPSVVTIEPGSFAWHNAYLLGLCLLGVVAVLTVESARRRALLLAGGALVMATAVAGALAIQ